MGIAERLPIDSDIAEGKKDEDDFRLVSAVYELSSDSIVVSDLDGNILRFNDAACRMRGYSREEMAKLNVKDLNAPESAELLESRFRFLVETGSSFCEAYHLRKDKSLFPVEIHASVIDWGAKKLVVAIHRDITRRRQAEGALRESEKLYRTLFDNGEDGFMLVEPIFDLCSEVCDFRLLKLNKAFECQTGVVAIDALGKRAKEVIPGLEAEYFLRVSQVVKTGGGVRFEQYNKLSERWFDIYCFLYSANQVGILFRDISERKKAEEELGASEQKYRNLVDKLPEMVIEINAERQVVFANATALETLGYAKEELYGYDANRFVAPEYVELSKKNMKAMFRGGMRRSNEYVFVKKDGTRFPVLLTSAPVMKDDVIVGARGIVVDLTARKKLEAQLDEKERLATIGATAGMVGHDIRNPLQAISGDVFLMHDYVSFISDSGVKLEAVESLECIEENIDYINKIVADLQDYARPLHPEYVDFVDLGDVLVGVFDAIQVPESIDLSFCLKGCPKFRTDPAFVRRALTNLVTNSIQAMPSGGKLEVAGFVRRGKICIVVSDTGVGIPDEVKPRLFTPMVTTKSKGQGLGLAVVKRLVEALGGRISFESDVCRGTEFFIELPNSQ